jgi:hypothetical protein
MRKDSELVLLIPLFPIFLLGMLPLLVLPLVGLAGLAVIGVLMTACGFAEYLRAMEEYNEHTVMRGYSARSDQARYLSSLKSGLRLAKGLGRRRGLHSLHRHRRSLRHLLTSACGTFETCRLRRAMSVVGASPEGICSH